MWTVALAWTFVWAAEPAELKMDLWPDRANGVQFPAQEARFVRLVIQRTNGTQPCIDELELYGPDGPENLALAAAGAKASASSLLPGYPQHRIEHLNDGRYGNASSWIPATEGEEWAQIELPKPAKVNRVVISRDREGQYGDRVPTDFEVQLSLDGKTWKSVVRVVGRAVGGAGRAQPGGFVGVVGPAPPPPRMTPGTMRPEAQPAADLLAPKKDALGFENLALRPGTKAAASSLLPGYPIHQIAHLNDGRLGNSHSWISQGEPSWAEIDLAEPFWVYKVAFGSDTSGQYQDRAPRQFAILAAREYQADSSASSWQVVYQSDGAPVHLRREFTFRPVQARWVRVAIQTTSGGQARIDELEVYGQKEPIPLEKIGPLPSPGSGEKPPEEMELLRYAFLSEEHAWLKTFGRADLDPSLVPYNGRVKEYPRHVGDDRLPLPPLRTAPKLDGNLDDPCWQEASRGVARVAHLADFDQSPLVETAVWAGWKDKHLYLALQTDRLLSSHLAVVSSSSGQGCGVVALEKEGLVFKTYLREGPHQAKLDQTRPVEGAWDATLRRWELRLPLEWFPNCQQEGLRVGLGMGGRHTPAIGRPVHFVFADLAVAEEPPCVDRTFRVRLRAPAGGKPCRLQSQAQGWPGDLLLQPGLVQVVRLPAERGPIGPQLHLSILEPASGQEYRLHLFRYDPLERTLTLWEEMLQRLERKGLPTAAERQTAAEFRRRQEELLKQAPDERRERETFFAARLAKRRTMFRDPDLGPLGEILFVKRYPYEPSHNYSVMLDAPWRPGGGIYRIRFPWIDGRLEPGKAELQKLFDSGSGIARDPVATFDCSKIYFAYRRSEPEYFHIMRMNPDGSGLEQLTSGPFHDYFPCPLPDGGLAMISTRCKARYLCWRPQVAVLFRMEADGSSIRPLSFANLSEWGPSVTRDGRIIWQRSEYIDKGADFSHTLWTIRPDGTHPELVFGNTIIQPNGYASGREVPGTREICCVLISHFGDLNGPVALLEIDKGRFNPAAIKCLTPEIPWPGWWPRTEYFRDPYPISRDYILCSHAPRERAGLCLLDRYGNREMLYMDSVYGCMSPTPFRPVPRPPVLVPEKIDPQEKWGQMVLVDVYQGIEEFIPRGKVKYLRVVEEVRANLEQLPNGEYRKDHEPFMHFYAAPVDRVSGPYGWPSYVAKAPWGLVPVEADGSAHFYAPAGKTLYFQILDEDLNELQRMRSVVQLQPGERRSCIGCHEDRRAAPPAKPPLAMLREPVYPTPPPWGAGPFSYEKVVQPVLDRHCASCHDHRDAKGIDLTGTLDLDRIPSSYKTLIRQGWVHVLDCGWNSGGNEKRQPLTFGTLKSRLWEVLGRGHYDVRLSRDEIHAIKCWIDMNCPLWPDYIQRELRPGPPLPQLSGNK